MAKLDSLIVDLQVNTAALRKGLDDATGMFEKFGKKMAEVAEAAAVLEVLKVAVEAVAKAAEFMEQGLKDAAALGNGPSRQLLETFDKLGLSTRQLGADLMSNLAPAFNSLISWFTEGVDLGKILASVAGFLADAFRTLVAPIVMVAGAVKGLAEGGSLDSALVGAVTAVAKLAEHGKDFAGSLLTAQQAAEKIAAMQKVNADMNIGHEANRMSAQFENLSGDRKRDKFAGAMDGFGNFEDALNKWKENMKEAASLTEQAAVEDAHGSKVRAEALRLEADQATQAADHAKLAADGFRFMKEKLIVDTQAINNIKFDLAESLKGIARGADVKSQKFTNTYNPTKGFENFGDALDKETKALRNETSLRAVAEMLEKQYGAAAQGTVLALKEQADAEGRAADAASKAADAFFAVKDKLRDQLVGALQVAGDAFTSKLGALGSTINDAIKGFQQGGIWGALAALVMDLLSMMDGWKEIQNIAQGQLMMAMKDMASGLNSIIGGLKPLMGAIESIAHALHGVLNPILGLIGKVLGALAPIFESIGISMQVMNPIINMICELLGAILIPILQLLNPILQIVAETFLGTELALEYVDLGLNMFVDWIDKFFGSNNKGGVAAAQKGVDDTIQQMKDVWNVGLGGLADKSADTAEAMGKTADQTDKTANAMSKLTSQLTNVPAGFRIALDTFNSTTPSAAKDSGIHRPFGDLHIHASGGVTTTIDQLVMLLQQAIARGEWRKKGARE